MTISSVSSSAISSPAILGLSRATSDIAASTYRLANGSRFYRASDDVASLSIATRLQSSITSYRQAQLNNSQADSLLQVAYGGLSNIGSLLDDMNALASQATSGSLTPVQRADLNLQFQNLRDEVDRVAAETNFNGISLLDGSIAKDNTVTSTQTNATQATGSLLFTVNPVAGQTVNINGVSLVANTDFAIGGSTNITATNLANALSASTNPLLSQATYLAAGSSVNITHRAGGKLGEQFVINEAASTAAASFIVSGKTTATANVFGLQGGLDNGLYMGSTKVSGTIGDSLVNALSQTQSQQTVTINTNGTIVDLETLRIDNGTAVGTINFQFRTAAPVGTADFAVGATAEVTLQNAINTITQFANTTDTVLNQLEYEIVGDNQLIIRGRLTGTALDQTGAAGALAETATGVSISGASLNNGTNTGVDTSGVMNAGFTGTIGGFSATYNSADNITASITVGGIAYNATITDTTPAAATFTRFNSSTGGYFDVQLAAGGMAVGSQANADTFAARLDAAFAPLNFTQSRFVSNFSGVGQLAGATSQFQLDDFSDVTINDIEVTGALGAGTNATIDITVNGDIFRNAALGQSIGAHETVTLTSLTDPTHKIRITNGGTQIDLSNASNAATFQDTLETNFDLGNGGASISFQMGPKSSDTIRFSISSASSDRLFGNVDPDLTTAGNAAAAQATLGSAIDKVGTLVANVGSVQQRITYAGSAISDTITQFDMARAAIANTDFPTETTAFANAVVRQQASIAVLAQTQQLGSNLLDLLRPR